jgi:lipid-A-disaccharide synthase-like uncharacterized protein
VFEIGPLIGLSAVCVEKDSVRVLCDVCTLLDEDNT